ncbi:hypothetical protein AVEN_2644-1 [Araneus ventricosus]|uniref:ATP-dependent DNA helicase n=1 Tax=Araneus ventricosus TaxID=182803 RepID=A0A4Y2QB18_ARAVE|nr:hypothetical protein AVEN_2644-1 [Araneus ventricosus]
MKLKTKGKGDKQLMLKEKPLLELLKLMMKYIDAKQLIHKELPLLELLKLKKKFSGPNLFFPDGSAGTGQTFVYHAFLEVDSLLQDLTNCPNPFGGKVVLLGGDFQQVLSVILRGSRSLTAASFLKKHCLWSWVRSFESLTVIFSTSAVFNCVSKEVLY